MILFADGIDTSSLISREHILEKLGSSRNVRLICVGLAVNETTQDELSLIAKCSAGGVYISATDTKFDQLYLALMHYSKHAKVDETYEELLN